MSPTERTLSEVRRRHLISGIVERFIHNKKVPTGIRSDLFRIFDIISISKNHEIIGVQSCGTAYSSHLKKITETHKKNAILWLKAGGKIELYSWTNNRLRFKNITIKDIEPNGFKRDRRSNI